MSPSGTNCPGVSPRPRTRYATCSLPSGASTGWDDSMAFWAFELATRGPDHSVPPLETAVTTFSSLPGPAGFRSLEPEET